jgi:hypothetical protein
MLLPLTQEALYEFDASEMPGSGDHNGYDIASGMPGLVIGEAIYDPMLHRPEDIYHMSVRGAATGDMYVQLKKPERPLAVNVVIHEDSRDHPMFARAKEYLGGLLVDALDEALPGIQDVTNCYYMGKRDLGFGDFEHLPLTEDADANARTLAEVCNGGLSFVLSRFNRLPIERHIDPTTKTVGVLVSHPAEYAFPAGHGVISLGGSKEVNTSSRRQLARKNAELQAVNDATDARLNAAGIATAPVLFDPRVPYHKWDAEAADRAIAQAVTTVARK